MQGHRPQLSEKKEVLHSVHDESHLRVPIVQYIHIHCAESVKVLKVQ